MTVPIATMSTTQRLDRLKEALQVDLEAKAFEKLVAALISDLLGVGIAVAASGFQHGGDAGPAGRLGRRFRIETKRYSDTTALSNRELLGEMDNALARDEALEAWFLAATREVPEQLENELHGKAEKEGVPVVIIDWKNDSFPALAALCSHSPATVGKLASAVAGELSKALAPDAAASLQALTREMGAWQLGFDTLRTASHRQLELLWKSPRDARGTFGQDTASGAYSSTIPRGAIAAALQAWWSSPSHFGSPAVVLGNEGVGKTWATIDWLAMQRDILPIVLAIPSSAVTSERISLSAIKRLLAERLHEITATRDAAHWQRRLEHLLKRPPVEGPVLVLFLDGLNQQPSTNWIGILQSLQLFDLVGQVRVVVSTRKFHFEERLASLRGLHDPPSTVRVEMFEDSPGGELDQRLQREGLKREDLHPALITFARVPRLFALVVEFKDRLVDAGKVTVHRLLWEYGRDTLGVRGGSSFSEAEWRQWLLRAAEDHRQGHSRYTLKALSERSERPDLNPDDVFRRLSDLIDAPFLKKVGESDFELSPTLVNHALGAALLTRLNESAWGGGAMISDFIATFLDPISGLDERAEILRAAVSISLEQDPAVAQKIVNGLVFAWLTTQNVPEEHRAELNSIAASLVVPLLEVVDSTSGRQRATEQVAINALRCIDRNDAAALKAIIGYTAEWFRQVPRGVDTEANRSESQERERANRLLSRIGADRNGPHTVLGVQLALVERWAHSGTSSAGALLDRFPLQTAMPAFEAVALHSAVRGFNEMWDATRWLVLLNQRDYHETVAALRSLANDVLKRGDEPGVNASLKQRVAALLLWLTGDESDERHALSVNPRTFYGGDRYVETYLSDPGGSFFALEQRHAVEALARTDLPIARRVEKSVEFLTDPEFSPPEQFVKDLIAHAQQFNTAELHAERTAPLADYFEKLEVALARCAPEQLAALHRRWLADLVRRSTDTRFLSASHADERLLLLDSASLEAIKALRLLAKEPGEREESAVTNMLLLLEIEGLDALTQYGTVIDAAPKYIHRELEFVLKPLQSFELDSMVTRYAGNEEQLKNLLYLLSLNPSGLEGASWNWAFEFTKHVDSKVCGVAFELMFSFDPHRFGSALLMRDWKWDASAQELINHYGSLALIEATRGLPFEHVAERLAPWLVLKAARMRGEEPHEVRLAAKVVDLLLVRDTASSPELGAKVFVYDEARQRDPFSFSILIEPEGDDPFEQLKAMSNDRESQRRSGLIVEAVRERVQAARDKGARLFLYSLAADDFRAVLRHSPTLINTWIEGMETTSLDFRRRVHLADGAYLALCEALLLDDTRRGVALWNALRVILTTSFKARAGVDKLILIMMRAPATDETTAALAGMLDLSCTNTDSELQDLTLASFMSGRLAWIASLVQADQAAGAPWRAQRAQRVNALIPGNDLPCPSGWAHGEMDESTRRHCAVDRLRHIEACSRHWFRRFWEANMDGDAYAAWVLFLHVADRRAYSWMAELSPVNPTEMHRRRAIHVALQERSVKRAVDKREKNLREHFLGRRTSSHVYPWLVQKH